MQNISSNPLADLDVSKARLFTLIMLGYLSLYVILGTMDSGDPQLVLSMDPLFLLGIQAVTSGVFFFLLPFLFWRFRLKLTTSIAFQKIDLVSFGYVSLIAISAMLLISVIGEWNMNIDLPDSAFEKWAQGKEAELKVLTDHMINFTGIGHFLGSILIIALIPALGEELIFRGIIQNLFARLSKNPHLAIWLSAVLFSAIHLQFYGFFPRVLLGALFGYLYLWSGRLSIAMLAHFFNNAIALCLVFISGEGWLEVNPEELDQAAPWPSVVVFLILGIFIMIKFKRHHSNERLA